jgi:CBS-domain-containing membrane protein
MLANRVSGLPVVDNSANLVGLISEGDLLRRVPEGTWPKAILSRSSWKVTVPRFL